MKNYFVLLLSLFIFSGGLFAQQLTTFNVSMNPDANSYLSINNKKAYAEVEAAEVKAEIDLSLVFTKDNTSPMLEWYNLSGKDGKTPQMLVGSAAKINAISFDREQFEKCKTVADLKRMTGHITQNSLSHFAGISHTRNEISQYCFIVETIAGKRALLWISQMTNGEYKVEVKQHP